MPRSARRRKSAKRSTSAPHRHLPPSLETFNISTTETLTSIRHSVLSRLADERPVAPERPATTSDLLHNEKDAIARALAPSENGRRLIAFDALPPLWRNNEHIVGGYRFIPLSNWRRLLASIFRLHNETANIHTHLIPLILWAASLAGFWVAPGNNLVADLLATTLGNLLKPLARILPFPITHDIARYTPFSAFTAPSNLTFTSSIFLTQYPTVSPANPPDTAETLFTLFAVICLTCSVVWHTMVGCAHQKVMRSCARIDYIGIGWLTAMSVSSVVHHGFACSEKTVIPAQLTPTTLFSAVREGLDTFFAYHPFGATCILFSFGVCGILGSIFPFCDWFDRTEYRAWKLSFFLSISLAGFTPLIAITALQGWDVMAKFVAPVLPSLVYYFIGVNFYATHFPECLLSGKKSRSRLARFLVDSCGLSSHTIWHVCIVLALRAHRDGIREMGRVAAKNGCAAGSW